MKNRAVLARIKKLATFLGQETRTAFETSVSGRHGASVRIDFKTGACVLETWMESYHNGDSYDETRKNLTPEEAKEFLDGIERRLFSQCEEKVLADAERDRMEKERARLRRATERAVFGK